MRAGNDVWLGVHGLKRDAWLSDILGKPATMLDISALEDHEDLQDLKAALTKLDAEGPNMAWTRVPTQNVPLTNRLEAMGFRIADVNVVFEKRCGTVAPPTWVREAWPEDAQEVEAMAGSAYSLDRFHQDLHTAHAADRLCASWAGNFFHGRRGDLMAVAEQDEGLAGFVLALLTRELAVVDLIAVHPKYAGRGVGSALLDFLEQRAQGRILRAGTQIANVQAINFYQQRGMRLVSSTYTLHRHGGS